MVSIAALHRNIIACFTTPHVSAAQMYFCDCYNLDMSEPEAIALNRDFRIIHGFLIPLRDMQKRTGRS